MERVEKKLSFQTIFLSKVKFQFRENNAGSIWGIVPRKKIVG